MCTFKIECKFTFFSIIKWIKEVKDGISLLSSTLLLQRHHLEIICKGEPLSIFIQNRRIFWPFNHHSLGVDEALQETDHLIIQQISQMFSNSISNKSRVTL